jgi:hypothetical protein
MNEQLVEWITMIPPFLYWIAAIECLAVAFFVWEAGNAEDDNEGRN